MSVQFSDSYSCPSGCRHLVYLPPPPRQPALTAHTLMRQSELSPATKRPLVLPGGVRNRITICHLVSINHYNPMRTSGFLRRHLMKQVGTTSPGVGGFMDLVHGPFFFLLLLKNRHRFTIKCIPAEQMCINMDEWSRSPASRGVLKLCLFAVTPSSHAEGPASTSTTDQLNLVNLD